VNDDIVARLRRLDNELVEDEDIVADFSVVETAADEIERLRAERDEARREVCTSVASGRDRKQFTPVNGLGSAAIAAFRKPVHPKSVARERGWDCFKEDGK
jgi:hypothetical protein